MEEEVLDVVGEMVKVAMAKTPFAMALLLMPVVKHSTEPTLAAHDDDLPAAVAAAPSVIWTAVKSVDE